MESQSQAASTADAGDKKLRRVLLIRLPSGEQTSGVEQPATSQIPPNSAIPSVNMNEANNTNNLSTATQAITGNTDERKNVDSNNDNDGQDGEETTNKKRQSKDGDSNMYKNYSPKQREWMLVYLGYARGLLGMPFEEKLQESVVQQTNSILAKRGRFCNINRIPSSKTLRTVWKNLWEERTVGSVIRKGGRPRIDPTIKREKRNERERKKRAAAREKKALERSMES